MQISRPGSSIRAFFMYNNLFFVMNLDSLQIFNYSENFQLGCLFYLYKKTIP